MAVASALFHLHLVWCLLPATRSLLPSEQLMNNFTPRHPLNTFTPLPETERHRRLSFLNRAYSPPLIVVRQQTDRQSLSLEMSSSRSSAAFGRKRRADEDFDKPAPKLTRKEGKDEKHTLKSKLDQEFDQNSLLRSFMRELDYVIAHAWYDTETELQREDAQQIVMYLSVSLLHYYHDRRLKRNQHRVPDICELSTPLIVELHKAFQKCKSNVAFSHDCLPLFLELSHKRAPATYGPDCIDSLVRMCCTTCNSATKPGGSPNMIHQTTSRCPNLS